MEEKPLDQHIQEMKALSEQLIPNTYPQVTFEEESKILPLKCRTIVVDGYEIAVNFSISSHKKYNIESIQIQSAYAPFLPFNMVCKIAKAFLGSEELSYIDFVKQNKKIYCWTVRKWTTKRKKNQIIPIKIEEKTSSFEGFEFAILNPGSVNLYES